MQLIVTCKYIKRKNVRILYTVYSMYVIVKIHFTNMSYKLIVLLAVESTMRKTFLFNIKIKRRM